MVGSSLQWATDTVLSVGLSHSNHSCHQVLLCRAPAFNCVLVRTVITLLSLTDILQVFTDLITFTLRPSSAPLFSSEEGSLTMVVKAPVRNGKLGYFQQVVCLDVRTRVQVPLSLGNIIVQDLLAWDTANSQL